MSASTVTATITKDPEYSRTAMVERRRWRVSLSDGRRRFTRTRREAIEWCQGHGFPYTVVS